MATVGLRTRLVEVHRRVSRNFVQRADRGEEWRMPPPAYDGSQTIKDDCDGFCLAVRHLLRAIGIPSRLVYCEIDGGGHLVVEVEGWILDNRQRTVVPNTLLRDYRWLRISGFAPGDPWRAISSW